MSSTPSISPRHVGLILLRTKDSLFYLEIPLNIINSLCFTPRKYLLFLGWCILGIEGRLVHNEHELDHIGPLVSQGIYSYNTGKRNSSLKVVDPEVIRMRSGVRSELTATRESFRNQLLERDTSCVWTGLSSGLGSGLYIIPYRRGSEWFRFIIQNRQDGGEDVTDLDDINDIRNGMFANNFIHSLFDARSLVVLKTPNRFLDPDDIPRHNRPDMPENVKYPTDSRYTLQRLTAVDERATMMFPNNVDAAFKKRTRKPKPLELLLHYNYGAAAVKWWGHNTQLLQNLAKSTQPPKKHVGAAAGPSRAVHDRSIVIQKRDAYRTSGAGAGSAGAGAGVVESMESGDPEMWDEDDVMLCIMASLPATQERHRKEVEEKTRQLEQWREGVAHV